MSEVPNPSPPEGARVPQEDYLDTLAKLREEVKGITIDGPSGAKFKQVLDRMLKVLLEVL